jgi:Flp pilus assembly protein TadG
MIRAGALVEFRSCLRRFARDRDAVSAVEFAIVLPFMLLLYIGGVELGDGLQIDFKATEVARTVTDLASQYTSIDTPTMSTILDASSTIVTPYPSSSMAVTVSQIKVTANSSQGSISWSCSLNGTARSAGSSITLPSSLQNPSSTIYLIFGEVTYPYTPSMGYVITGTINMYQNAYFYPRLVTSITGPSSCPTS